MGLEALKMSIVIFCSLGKYIWFQSAFERYEYPIVFGWYPSILLKDDEN